MSGAASLAKTHANYSHDWWTPPDWLAWVTRTLGREWFDPCPADWSPEHPSGLERRWGWPCYVNHPGARGSTAIWWAKYLAERDLCGRSGQWAGFIWCAFSIEQLRHQRPSALELPGWLVMPRARVPFIWGGPDMAATANRAERKHGEPMSQPGNWTVFWCTAKPADDPPVESIIIQTGVKR